MGYLNSNELKQFFQTGCKPTEQNFADLIDSCVNKVDSSITIDKSKKYVGIGFTSASSESYPQERLHVQGGIILGMSENNNAGTIRWNPDPGIFQGYDGDSWKSLSERSGGWLRNGSITYTNDKNIGIGTVTPLAKLHVNGAVIIGNCPESQGKPGMLRWNTEELQVFKDNAWVSLIKVESDENEESLSSDNTDNSSSDIGGVNLLENQFNFNEAITVNGTLTAANLVLEQEDNDRFWKVIKEDDAFAIYRSDTDKSLSIDSDGKVAIKALAINGDLKLNRGSIKDDTGAARVVINDSEALHLKGRGSSEALTITQNGNVGIGVTSPTEKLHVRGDVLVEDGDIETNKLTVASIYNDSEEVLYFNSGNVGIGTVNPAERLDVEGNIKCSGNAVADSDERVKKIHGESDNQLDLEILSKIKVTDFSFKDQDALGTQPQKKVIGQQVAEVFPQAVRKYTRVVPDIFETSSIAQGWVALSNHGLQTGDRVCLVWNSDNAKKESQVYTVTEAVTDSFCVDLDYEGTLFVYGREIDDFYTVDYQALSMLNISANQALYKKLQEQKKEIETLQHALNH